MSLNRIWLVVGVTLLAESSAIAQPSRYTIPDDKYQITDQERAACQSDAMLFCSMAFPDEDALVGCMKTARPRLTQSCRTIFEAGLRRRHIPF